MADPTPAADFVRALAAAVLREVDAEQGARAASHALAGVLKGQKSLVMDVQFTGFTSKGQPLVGVEPKLLRAAGQLIMQRVSRVGFTPEARPEDLAALFTVAARTPAESGGEGIADAMKRLAPRGIYLSTSTGETYRPEPAPRAAPAAPAPSPVAEVEVPAVAPAAEAPTAAPAAEAPAVPPVETAPASPPPPDVQTPPDVSPPSAPPPPAVETAQPAEDVAEPAGVEDEDAVAFSEFEILDDFPDVAGPDQAREAPAESDGREEPSSDDLYHFFRASAGGAGEIPPEELPQRLREAGDLTRFDELAQSAARSVGRLVRSDDHARAVDVIDALVTEAERPDRSRMFRDAAAQALGRIGTADTLQRLAELLSFGGRERERILRFFLFVGGDALPMLEAMLFRAGDAELRAAVFRGLSSIEGMTQKLMSRAMADASPVRTRTMLELAVGSGSDADVAMRWIGEAALHPDAGIRAEAARHAAGLGGRGLRLLVDLLGDADRNVKRAAIQHLGTLGDPAGVAFLSRLLADSSADEDVQIAVLLALGRIASPEALPALLSVVSRRQLLGGKKLARVKSAALSAIARIPTPGAREALHSVAGGKDADLSAEAKRLLETLG